jgi:hypothetical protein
MRCGPSSFKTMLSADGVPMMLLGVNWKMGVVESEEWIRTRLQGQEASLATSLLASAIRAQKRRHPEHPGTVCELSAMQRSV